MTEHTPEPWRTSIGELMYGQYDVLAAKGGFPNVGIARLVTVEFSSTALGSVALCREELAANGRLIAASPKLLAACEALLMDHNLFPRGVGWVCPFCQTECVSMLHHKHDEDCPVLAARKVIAEAKGIA